MHDRAGSSHPGGPAAPSLRRARPAGRPPARQPVPGVDPGGLRVVIVALGTRGDVEPAVRLGTALQHRGDQVIVATLADGAEHVARAGLSPLVVGPPSAEAMWWTPAWAREVAERQPGAMYLQTRTRLARHADGVAAALAPVVSGADLVVCGLAAAGLVPVLLRAGVPARLVLHAPLLPHPDGTSAWSGGWGELLPRPLETQRQALMWALTQGLSSALARALSRRVPGLATGLSNGSLPALPPLLSTSPVLDPAPSPDLVQTGWWADPRPVRPLPDETEEWIARQPGAVLLSLGNIAQQDPEDQVDRLVQVARRAGVPALVQIAGARPGPRPMDGHDAALVIGDVDHRALLPRVRAAVHHGGSGTTHAVTAAGRPQLVVPRLGDQPHYGRQVHRAGLGPAAVWHTRANPVLLSRSLSTLLQDPVHVQTAGAAAARMATEDGLAHAVHELRLTAASSARVGSPR